MSDPGKQAVPKFASFRPKAAAVAPQPAQSKTDETRGHRDYAREDRNGRDGESHKHRRRSLSRHRDESSHHRKRSHRARGSDEEDQRRHKHRHRDDRKRRSEHDRVKKDGALEEPQVIPWDSEKEFYVLDRKGDPANLTYGKPHRYAIPTYHRVGYGCVLGLQPNAKIDRASSGDGGIVIHAGERQGRQERRLLSKQRTKELPTLRIIKPVELSEPVLLDHDLDFIPIERSRNRKRLQDPPDSPSGKFDFRIIEDKKAEPENELSDSDLEYESDAANSALYQNFFREAKERNALLSRGVKDDPKNIETWLELIEHQETMVRIGSTDIHRDLTASEMKVLASIRLDLYQEAAKSIDSDRLKLGILEESSKIMQRDEYSGQWKRLLEKDPNNVKLWVKYLDDAQTSLTEFRYDDCRLKFLECLKILLKANSTSVSQPDLEELRIYVFLRLTVMMRESGYHERATALWQAMLEFHVLSPLDRESGHPDQDDSLLTDFEEFWESECPRIGELNYQGWAASKRNDQWPDPPEPKVGIEEYPESRGLLAVFADFSRRESQLSVANRWPGRTVDEVVEDDPYHIILFADIEQELRLMRGISSPFMLVQAFLCYWHLPPVHDDQLYSTRKWWLDPFLRNENLHPAQKNSPLILNGGIDDDERDNFPTKDWPMKSLVVTTETLFRGDIFWHQQDSDEQLWLRRCFMNLLEKFPGDSLAEYYLAWEFHCNPLGAARAAKTVLKRQPSSLRLYNAYAIIETGNGKSDVGDHVFTTAIGMSAQLPLDSQIDLALLWRSWVWEALRVGDVEAAKHRIASIGTPKPSVRPNASATERVQIDQSTALRVRRVLTEGRDHALSNGLPEKAILYSECYCLLAYLHRGNDIHSALDIFRETSSLLESRGLGKSFANEANHQARCQLLAWHMSYVKPFKPSVARSELAESISLFPSNTNFLSLFAVNEARFRIDDRVRAIMRDVVLRKEDQTVVGWLFSIYAEMQREEALGGTKHAVRAAFERAVGNDSCKQSSAMWVSYVLYMCSTRDLAAAKAIFFRGLLHLPFSKSFIMMGFENLREAMTVRELKGLYNTMQEKELRVHLDMDEVTEDVDRYEDRS